MFFTLEEASRNSDEITFNLNISDPSTVPASEYGVDYITGVEIALNFEPTIFELAGPVILNAVIGAEAKTVNYNGSSDGIVTVVFSNSGTDPWMGNQFADPFVQFTVRPTDGNQGADFDLTLTNIIVNGFVPNETLSAPTALVTIPINEAVEDGTIVLDTTQLESDGATSLTYLWYVEGSSSTETTNTLSLMDDTLVGKSVYAEISYTDAGGAPVSTITNSVTVQNINDDPTGFVEMQGEAKQGSILTADLMNVYDRDNKYSDSTTTDELGIVELGSVTNFKWMAGGQDISREDGNGTLSSLQLTQEHVGKVITVDVTYTDAHGESETVSSGQSSLIQNLNDAPTGAATIVGADTATQFGKLTADISAISDPDNSSRPTGAVVEGEVTGYTWFADDVEINGQTGKNLTLAQEHVGKIITVDVAYTDAYGAMETVDSNSSIAVVDINDGPTGDAGINGQGEQLQKLTVDVSSVYDPDNISDTNQMGAVDEANVTGYSWYADDLLITGENGKELILTQEHVGKDISAALTYTDNGGFTNNEAVSNGYVSDIKNVNDTASVVGDLIVSGVDAGGLYMEADLAAIADLDNSGPQSEANVQQYHWTVGDQAAISSNDKKFYIPDDAQGKKISLQVDFTDDLSGTETVSSDLDVVSLDIKPVLLASDLGHVTINVNIPGAYQESSYDAWEIVATGRDLPEDGIKLTATKTTDDGGGGAPTGDPISATYSDDGSTLTIEFSEQNANETITDAIKIKQGGTDQWDEYVHAADGIGVFTPAGEGSLATLTITNTSGNAAYNYDSSDIVAFGAFEINLSAATPAGKWSATADLSAYNLSDASGLTFYAVGSLSGEEKFWSSTHEAEAYPSILSVSKLSVTEGSIAQDVTIIWDPTGTADPREYGIDVFDAIAEGALDVVSGEALASITVKASGESSSTLDAILDDKLPADKAPDYTHSLVSNTDGSVNLGLKDDEGPFTIQLTKTADGFSVQDLASDGVTPEDYPMTFEGFSVVRIWDNDGPQDLRIASAEIATNSSGNDFQILGTIFKDDPFQLEFNGSSQGLQWTEVDPGVVSCASAGSGVNSYVLKDDAGTEVATLQKTIATDVIELNVIGSVRSDGSTTNATYLLEGHETLTILPEARAKPTNFDLDNFEIPPQTNIVSIEPGEGRTVDAYSYEVVVEFDTPLHDNTSGGSSPELNITIGGEAHKSSETKIVDGGTEARFSFDLINAQGAKAHGEVRLVDITGKVLHNTDSSTELVTNLEDKGNFSDEFIVNSIYSDLSDAVDDAPANSLYATDVASAFGGDLAKVTITNNGDYDQLYLTVDGVPGSSLLFDSASKEIVLYKPDQSEEVVATLGGNASDGFTLTSGTSVANIPAGIDSLTFIAGDPDESVGELIHHEDDQYSTLELPLSADIDVTTEATSGARATNTTIEGTTGDDTIYVGMPDTDSLIDPTAVGFAGDVDGGGSKQIFGSFGDDTIYGHKGVDYVDGGGGDDVIRTYAGHDEVDISSGHDVVDGGAGDDVLSVDQLEEYMEQIGVDGLRSYSADITKDGDSEYVVEARVDGDYVQLASVKRVMEVDLYGAGADTYAYVDMGEAFDKNGSTHFKVKITTTKNEDGSVVESATASADVLPTPMTQAQVDAATSAASIGTFELTAPFVITGSKDPYSGALEDITTAFNFEAMETVLPGGELLHFEVQEVAAVAAITAGRKLRLRLMLKALSLTML